MADDANHGGPRSAPAKKDLPDAYRELLEALRYANNVFEEKEDCGREGIIMACHAVARFIAVTHKEPSLVAPPLAMRAALKDPAKGGYESKSYRSQTPPVGADRETSLKKHAIMTAAVCLEALVKLGDPPGRCGFARSEVCEQMAWNGRSAGHSNHRKKPGEIQQRGKLPAEVRKPFDIIREDLLSCGDTRGETESLLRNGPPGIPKT